MREHSSPGEVGPHRSDPDLVVLHTLRCCGFLSSQRLAALLTPVLSVDVEEALLRFAAQGMVRNSGGTFGGWGLTDAGRELDATWIALELDRAEARRDVQLAYEDFLGLNPVTLEICGDWQVRKAEQPIVLNDHTDRVYDGSVLTRLHSVDAAAQPVCARLAARLLRFGHYGPRLASALDRARHGELDQVTDSLDSYHSVWFQLHEDLLVTLGLSRGG
jgi:hypothetical protein